MTTIRPWSYLELANGGFALVDDEDLPMLTQWRWVHTRDGQSIYVTRSGSDRALMHRVLLQPSLDLLVDHINGNGLDNRRFNLRTCTRAENARNRHRLRSSSGYRGVAQLSSGKWQAQIKVNGRSIYLGSHVTAEDAAKAYDAAARSHFGEFANTNFPEVAA